MTKKDLSKYSHLTPQEEAIYRAAINHETSNTHAILLELPEGDVEQPWQEHADAKLVEKGRRAVAAAIATAVEESGKRFKDPAMAAIAPRAVGRAWAALSDGHFAGGPTPTQDEHITLFSQLLKGHGFSPQDGYVPVGEQNQFAKHLQETAAKAYGPVRGKRDRRSGYR